MCPILQALNNIVRETAGNVVVANAVQSGSTKASGGRNHHSASGEIRVFPPMVISMVDVGEQTGALPEMLLQSRTPTTTRWTMRLPP